MRWRLRRFFRESGLLLAVLLLFSPLSHASYDPGDSFGSAVRVVDVPIVALLVLCSVNGLRWWLRYKRPWQTLDCAEAIGPVLASEAPYCLLLRTFGGDGSVLLLTTPLIGLWSPALTLEQVTARAMSRHHRMRTYTLVDADVRHSPPGPVYLRSPDDEWRFHIAALMGKAAHIVLLLAPGREMRRSLEWEIDEIRGRGLQHRVIIVFPPCGWKGRYYRSHLEARRNVEQILTRLELSGVDVRTEAERMHHALAVRIAEMWDGKRRKTHGLIIASTVLTRWRLISASTYDGAFAVIGKQFARAAFPPDATG
ncbi:hypothetical protein [Streptomyces sp. NPDC002889]|uniref:hypothetical protein n=1 Tax=Streptomyces sp. NPDC002889 TaxID=3364669 RepID=UPI0036998C2D